MYRIPTYIYLIATLFLSGISAMAQPRTVARMNELTLEEAAGIKKITLTGQPDTKGNSDFRRLRDLCRQVESIDLGPANCPRIPQVALHSRHQLKHLILPANIREIGAQAFFACDALEEMVLPAGLVFVGEEAFSGCGKMKSLHIKGTPQLGAFSFGRCKGLRTITVDSPIPPPADDTAFDGVDGKKVRLLVPKGSKALYRKASGWRHLLGYVPEEKSTCSPGECLIPLPSGDLEYSRKTPLDVKRTWCIKAGTELKNEAERAEEILRQRTGMKTKKTGENRIVLLIDKTLKDREAYHLKIEPQEVTISGGSPAGVFYGLMTFDQLLRGDGHRQTCDYIPTFSVTDRPRTGIRELMVDPARIFIPLEELKGFIVEMSRYKYNALHLHLVDDQAWRIEIKHYPRLTEMASRRIGMDDMQFPIEGYYTQKEMRELVTFAARYHVEIIPEIEMPGHEVAAIHCYPRLTCGEKEVPLRTTCGVSNELLCPGEPFVYEFLGHVFRELAKVFPSKYVHLGGDEAGNPALGCWTDCRKCRALKRRLGIEEDRREDNWQLQKYLFDCIIDTLQRHGKVPMFWYETDFKTIRKGCITFAWRHGLTHAAIDAAIANNARIILCPGEHCYLDYPMMKGDMPEVNWGMPVTSLAQTYSLDPAWGRGTDFENRYLVGVAGTLWSECINSMERTYYQAYPRALALAEAGWSPQTRRNGTNFARRLRPVLRDMARRGIARSAMTALPETAEPDGKEPAI